MASYKVGDSVRATSKSYYAGRLGRISKMYSGAVWIMWDGRSEPDWYVLPEQGFFEAVVEPVLENCKDMSDIEFLGTDAADRKNAPMFEGLLAYFPNALAAVAHVSKVGNDQHNPGQPLHWAFDKSTDEADCIIRHLADRGKFDGPVRHSAKVAWRALALLERELLAANPKLQPGANVKGAR